MYEGVYIDTQHTKIEQLIEHVRNDRIALPEQRQQLDLLERMNARHAQARHDDSALESRIRSFELGARARELCSGHFRLRDGFVVLALRDAAGAEDREGEQGGVLQEESVHGDPDCKSSTTLRRPRLAAFGSRPPANGAPLTHERARE